MPRSMKGLGRFAAFGILALSLVLSRAAVGIQTFGFYNLPVCRVTHMFCEKELSDFWPSYFLSFVEPFSRLATENLTNYAQDIQAGQHRIFGSMGRAITLDHALYEYLLNQNMIQNEAPNCYHFKRPWNTEKLSDLGIRYILQKDGFNEDLVSQGWSVSAQIGDMFLYRNSQDTGLVYYWEDGKRVPASKENISFKGNGMDIQLPPLEKEQELVVTLSLRPAWKARIDGHARPVYAEENRMMRIKIKPGDSLLSLRYEPFLPYHFIVAGALSLLIFFISWKAVKLHS